MFDEDCSRGIFCQRLMHWIPSPEMLEFSVFGAFLARIFRISFGWTPIFVWRGRGFSRKFTRGIIRRRSNIAIVEMWDDLARFALKPDALRGAIMQTILLVPDISDAALRVEVPVRNSFIYHIKYKTAPNKGIYMQREVNIPERSVEHKYIFSNQAGRGIAKDMMKRSLELYYALGIRSVFLKAGLSLGGAIWAKYGFRPIDAQQWEGCKSTILRNWQGMLDIGKNASTLRSHNLALEQILRSSNPRAIWDLIAMDTLIHTTNDETRKLGEALLVGCRWRGVLDLSDTYVQRILASRLGL